MEKEFDLLVFIGRFQPFHIAHQRVIEQALEKSNKVLVLVGSSGNPRSTRNPFTYEERQKMILESFSFTDGTQNRIVIKPLYDKTYNDSAWIKQVQDAVVQVGLEVANPDGFHLNGLADIKVGLIGAAKDHTSYYLKMFPQWGSVDVSLEDIMHATVVREHYLDGSFQRYMIQGTMVNKRVADFLFDEFIHTEEYQQLRRELQHVRDYKKAWAAAPYPVKHVTCDAVVEQSGHVLLVKRRAEPGKGLWALPGGHLEEHERLLDGVIRELREETMIKVPVPVLKGSIVQTQMFDDPHRSNIGRVITFAAHIKLPSEASLPKVKGSDDAEKAKWVPISELKENQFFDDHYHILCYFLGI